MKRPARHPTHDDGQNGPPAWWLKLPKPSPVVIRGARPGSVYQLAAVRREQRRLAILLQSVAPEAHPDLQDAIVSVGRAADLLLADLERDR